MTDLNSINASIVSPENWQDYKWQYRHSIRNVEQVSKHLNLTDTERQAIGKSSMPFLVTPYYLSLMDPNDIDDPIRKTIIPRLDEFVVGEEELVDPLGEDQLTKVEGLVHRYPDRVLFLVTNFCSTYCRYCTRSRLVGDYENHRYTRKKWDECIDYIQAHPQVHDVLLSGGDALSLPNHDLAYLIEKLDKIEHVQIIRIGTKIPAVLPMRVTQELCDAMKISDKIWCSVHFTHSRELTEDCIRALDLLHKNGFPMMSQTVLLKGVNDDPKELIKLFKGLIRHKVKPYYLLHCDLVKGSRHFRTTIERSQEILHEIQSHISGYAVPKLVVDLPGGAGKVQLGSSPMRKTGQGHEFLNYKNEWVLYPEVAKTNH